MDAELSTEILSIKIEEMKVFLTITNLFFNFYNNPKHKNLHAYEFYKEKKLES